MAGQRAAGRAAQQPEPVVEPAGDLGDRQRLGAGGGQLDGQREAVEVAHERWRSPDPARRRRRSAAAPRWPDRRTASTRRRRRAGRAAPGARRRPTAARGWWSGSARWDSPAAAPRRASPRHRRRARSCRGSPPRRDRRGARSPVASASVRRASASAARSGAPTPAAIDVGDDGAVDDRRQLDEPHLAVGRHAVGELQREARLADARRVRRRSPGGPGRGCRRRRSSSRRAPDERRQRDGQRRLHDRRVRRPRSARRGPGPAPGRPVRAPAAPGPGRGPARREVVTGVAVGGEGIGLATAAVQGDDQLGPEPLPERVLDDQLVQAADARRRGDRSPAPASTRPSCAASDQLLQAARGISREPAVDELAERRAAHEVGGGPELLAGGGVVAPADGVPPGLDEAVEAGGVDGVGIDAQDVPGSLPLDRHRARAADAGSTPAPAGRWPAWPAGRRPTAPPAGGRRRPGGARRGRASPAGTAT